MKKNIIAIVYDFDGTLSPLPMQEYTVLPKIPLDPKQFWGKVRAENTEHGGEEIITYMMLMLKKANDAEVKITKADLGRLASQISYYPGVEDFFERINEFVTKRSGGKARVRHYIISSGLKEILRKVSIKKYFHNIFGSEYAYDHYGAAQYPKLVVTDTVKTQFLFRINKGREKITDSINESMGEELRPIPFQNLVYIGDGMTDVPCMTVATKNGGYAIAVYKQRSHKGLNMCRKLFKANRVDFIATADYRKNSELEKYLQVILESIIEGIKYRSAQEEMIKKRILQR
ncbi:MAG TPA: HAD family hydrolase [Sedimentisphaerales bacterium]|nr:HAD family hydrolase [Sedimentisphaerales bacterium]